MDCVVASVWQKKKACVSGEKFERTLAHDFEADFFIVVCTRVYNKLFRFHFISFRTILEINVGT